MGKDDARIVALGDIDEASSFLGLARAEADEEVGGLLIWLQRLLYRVMGDLAMPKEDNVVDEDDLKHTRRHPRRVARTHTDPQRIRHPG